MSRISTAAGGMLHDLMVDAFGENLSFRNETNNLLGNITTAAFPSLLHSCSLPCFDLDTNRRGPSPLHI